jgi:hypothetical protein
VRIELKVGDVIIDTVTKESGVLVRRVNLFEDASDPPYPPICAWEILWAGKAVDLKLGRKQSYTENGLINMIIEGTFQLLSNS